MTKTVSVYNTRNSKRVFEYEEGSYTHKQAIAQNGGWRLANEEQVKVASQKKKVAESAEDETAPDPIAINSEPTPEVTDVSQLQDTLDDKEELNPKPKKEAKPKGGAANKNQTKEAK